MGLLGQSWSSTSTSEQALPELLFAGHSHCHGQSNLCDKKPAGQQSNWPEITVAFVEVYHHHPSSVFVPLLWERTGLYSIFNEKGKHVLNEETIQSSYSVTTDQGRFMSEVLAQLIGFQKISAGVFVP